MKTREEALAEVATCANTLRKAGRATRDAGALEQVIADRLGKVCGFLRAAPAAPTVPEVGDRLRARPGTGHGHDARATVQRRLIVIRYDEGDETSVSPEYLACNFEPLPSPPAPEPQEQLWYVTQRQSAGLLVNVVLYRNRHDGDCDNRWGREWEARKFPLAEAGAVIESEATRPGSRAVYVYGIEPAGRVRA